VTLPFDQATRSEPLGGGRYRFTLTEDWFGYKAPHGGFLAAAMLRAMQAEVADDARHPRSMTVHFAAGAAVGDVEIEVREERRGGRLSTVSARVHQGGQVMALALAALSTGRDGPHYADAPAPEVASPEAIEALPMRRGFAQHLDYRPAIGARPLSGAQRAESGGWMRFVEPAPIDAAAVVCFTDAWIPAILPRLQQQAMFPTIDLTVHFRAELPVAGAGPGDSVLARFTSQHAEQGFWEENGEVWTAGGRLLAQSRQLALVIPRPTQRG
jgi:acyl-CoA thioesterase